jgi:hypothetical protein
VPTSLAAALFYYKNWEYITNSTAPRSVHRIINFNQNGPVWIIKTVGLNAIL